jgi:kynureninase
MLTLQDAQARDRADELARLRGEFHIPPGVTYLNGNSLGLLSKPAETAVNAMLDQWKRRAGAAWMDATDPWFDYTERVSARLARFVGAQADEVIAVGSTSSNLHQLLSTFYHPTNRKFGILIDELAFPSDAYAVQSHLRVRGLDVNSHLRKVKSREGATLLEEDIEKLLAIEPIALAVLPAVVYGSGQLLDLQRLNRAARSAGVTVLWDCSHAVGAVPLNFSALGCELAFWCHYKYMNAGPGAVAGMYVNQKHLTAEPGIAGWFGMNKQRQFLMQHTFEPAAGAGRYQVGSPHLLSLAALNGSLALFERVDIQSLRAKSIALTDFLMNLIDERLKQHGVSIITPRDSHRRGGHVSISHPDAERLCKSLAEQNIIVDFRRPSIVRITPAAMYNSFEECFRVVEAMIHSLSQYSGRGLG